MCGIAGIMGFGNFSISCNAVKRMTEVMLHRGPDDEGYLAVSVEKRDLCAFGGVDTSQSVYVADVPSRPKKNVILVGKIITDLFWDIED